MLAVSLLPIVAPAHITFAEKGEIKSRSKPNAWPIDREGGFKAEGNFEAC